ncbi:hypothetical protein ACFL0V_02205 [Nanoarchaeota archaeon]
MRKKRGKQIDLTKWRYSKQAFRKRYCEECGKVLAKDESIVCKGCYRHLMREE